MAISVHEVVETVRKVEITDDFIVENNLNRAIVNKIIDIVADQMVSLLAIHVCNHEGATRYQDIHFHRHEIICDKCGCAIGFYDQYSSRKFFYPEERKQDEVNTLNMSNVRTPKEYEMTS